MTDFDFSGKVVLVTGSSRGIGAAAVSAFGQRGARCIVNYVADEAGRNQADAEQVAKGQSLARVIQCDVGSADEVRAMAEKINAEYGGLDILVNNAGILRDRTIKKMSTEEWESVLRVNLNGAFSCIQSLGAILRPAGRIVNIASVSGQMGLFGQANYAASKAGIIALTKVAAREFARQQITVNAVAPGFINTEIHRSMPQETTNQFLSQIPLGRFGEPEEVVFAVLFLCSAQARYVTGQVVHVNGGFLM